MRRPQGIIFDLGDTVIRQVSSDPLEGNRRMLEFADHNPGVTAEDAMKIVEEISPWIDSVRDGCMAEFSADNINRLIYETLGVTFRIGYDKLEKVFWNGALTYTAVEGIFELLDTLDAHGIKTGILSNSIHRGTVLGDELAKHGLAHRFSFVMASADYGIRKPHKYLFRVAIKKMRLPPSAIWFVGDKIEYDVMGALEAGLYPVWYNWQQTEASVEGEFLEVRSMKELAEIVKTLCATG
jgi:putative hydrolase of the HAD superfamily